MVKIFVVFCVLHNNTDDFTHLFLKYMYRNDVGCSMIEKSDYQIEVDIHGFINICCIQISWILLLS